MGRYDPRLPHQSKRPSGSPVVQLPRPSTKGDDSASSPPRVARYDVQLDASKVVDADALKVVRRLAREGFEAYLVGGCVRDLLLGRRPKDFDVATSARPEDVRALFRNSRVIGRRFRLVHVLFAGRKVIEVATFRRNPTETDPLDGGARDADDTDLLIRSDNAFGVAHEDAARRDFTINALFFDVEKAQIIDWVGGMHDIKRRVVRTIGDPITRFREDPIRILRAIKFAARLDLGIEPDVYDAMVQSRDELGRAARPRVFEEILRLLRGGGAHRSIWIAWETGVLSVLLPELAAFLDDDESNQSATRAFRILGEVDRRTRTTGAPLDDVVLFTTLMLEPMREACEGERDRIGAAFDFLDPIIERLSVPRRTADATRRILAILPRLETGRAGRFAKTELFGLASEVADIVGKART